jgi:pimeloyl-ACP methyl ester carboxylesterase
MSTSTSLGARSTAIVENARIEYRETGRGRPIVFLHGVLVNADLWRDVVPGLTERFRCIAPDWPLGSHTMPMPAEADLRPPGLAKLVAGFLDALGLEDVVLVASDTGGAIAQLVVTSYPERIGALVLTNCDAFENFFPPAFRALTWFAPIPGFVDGLAFILRSPTLQRGIAALVAHRTPTPEMLKSYFDPLRTQALVRRDLRRVVASVDSRYTLDAARRFGAFTKPVAIGWGEDDHIFFPLRYARRLRDAFPNCRLRTFAGSRTFVAEDRPNELAAFIAEFASEPRESSPQATLVSNRT